MGRAIKVFEPVTREQIIKMNARAAEAGLSKEELYAMVTVYAGIPFMTALSRQEAIVLIDRLEGKEWPRYPARARYENQIEGDTSELASFYHVRDIRLMLCELGWGRERIASWLVKYRKVNNIRSMDRKQAKATWAVLKGMVERKTGA
ncbi:MAG: hypothetical protein GX087_05225 [Desulfobulbaceae bacterium]|nr:hypothetical protein [Desulfobulbaceae bacterium]